MGRLESLMDIDAAGFAADLVEFIQNHAPDEGIILGLSGGLDSTVVAELAIRAVGPGRVQGLLMPDAESSVRHVRDAQRYARSRGIRIRRVSLTPFLRLAGAWYPIPFLPLGLKARLTRWFFRWYRGRTGKTPFGSDSGHWVFRRGNSYYRIKHRLRMTLLYYHAERGNRLVVGCANKTEYKTGFFVKHGIDHAADIMPLLALYKTQVRALAEYLAVPRHIIQKAPSPDIVPGIVDEEALGIGYPQLDLVLMGLEKGYARRTIMRAAGVDQATVDYVRGLVERSEHMRTVYHP
ncbi:MAG: NAD(+) synthase [Nanobdellota archaeon]